jgi:hypothetical protein
MQAESPLELRRESFGVEVFRNSMTYKFTYELLNLLTTLVGLTDLYLTCGFFFLLAELIAELVRKL